MLPHPRPLLHLLPLLLLAVVACAPGDDAADAPADTPQEATEAPATPDEPTPMGTAEPEDAGPDLLDPNLATAEELQGVEGLDSAAVATLVEGRPWMDMLEVDRALSATLDAETRERVYRELFLPLDLNEASSEEIMLIPGVGERMTHEFEEYRPYEVMAQFRREIGKYVDEEEVARLEQYVVIR